MKLTAVILTKNSEKTLKRVLKSVAFADEVIVVDDFSKDRTLDIARDYKAKIFKRSLNGDFSAQRNWALEKTNGDWVMFIDSDEEVSVPLKNEIIQAVNSSLSGYSGLRIKRRDTFLGKVIKTTEAGKISFIRVAKKGSGKWVRKVHESWEIKGKILTLKSYLNHYSHNSLKEFIGSINYFSTLHAQANLRAGKKSSITKIFFFPIAKFFRNWIILGGLKEGSRGFLLSLLMSVHSFLAWSKLWIIQRK